MDHYIKEALKTSKTIIIPEIGALTKISETTGELMFMNYLKHDDGVLAQFISNKEGITEQEAKNLLAKHSREITAILNKGEVYSIYKFGSFSKNDKGELQFEQYIKTTKSVKNKVKSEANEKAVSEDNTEKKKTKIKVKKHDEIDQTSIIEPALDKLEIAEIKNKTTEIEEFKEKELKINQEINETAEKISAIGEKGAKENMTKSVENTNSTQNTGASIGIIPESTINKNSASGTATEKTNAKEINNNVSEQKPKPDKIANKSSKNPLIIGLLVLLVSGALGTVIYQFVINGEIEKPQQKTASTNENKKNEVIQNDKNKIDTPQITNNKETESIDSAELAPAEPQKDDAVANETSTFTEVDIYKPYKIIAGTFQKRKFAQSFVKKLEQNKGIKSKIITKGGQNFVIINSYDNSKTANKELSKIKTLVQKAWILKMD
jgi:nucleoid DNA-binding protein